MRRLGALLVAAALALTGCIGAMAQGTPAMEHRERADQQATEAYPGAELVAVNAFESNESMDDKEEAGFQPGYPVQDDTIGDGGPPAWIYEYRIDNQTGYNVVVDEDGEVLSTERDDDVDEDRSPVEDWQITSTEAVEIVRDNNDTWTVDDDGVAFYHLSRDNVTSDPVWSMGESHEEHGFLFARVNAASGEFLGVESLAMDFGFGFGWSGWGGWGGWSNGWGSGWDDGENESPPPQQGGSFSGTVTVAEGTSEHEFRVDTDEHPELGLALSLEEPATGSVEVTLEGPEGELGSLAAGPQGTDTMETWDEPEEGSYVAVAELADGVDQAYELHWCAVGQPEGDQQASQACDEVYGEDEVAELAPW